MCIQGMVSQVVFIGPSFCLIKSNKIYLENTQKVSRFFQITRASIQICDAITSRVP